MEALQVIAVLVEKVAQLSDCLFEKRVGVDAVVYSRGGNVMQQRGKIAMEHWLSRGVGSRASELLKLLLDFVGECRERRLSVKLNPWIAMVLKGAQRDDRGRAQLAMERGPDPAQRAGVVGAKTVSDTGDRGFSAMIGVA